MVENTVKNLNRNGFKAQYFATMDQAKDAVISLIKQDESVGSGGSVTLKESGILRDLRSKGCEVISYTLDTPEQKAERDRMRMAATRGDWFISSSNAITEKGELVNIDGIGNRVGTLAFGTRKVLVLASTNKIVKDYEAAMTRIKTKACGAAARRLNFGCPCALDDKCHDCRHPDRICRIISIINYAPMGREFYVYLVGGEWGF